VLGSDNQISDVDLICIVATGSRARGAQVIGMAKGEKFGRGHNVKRGNQHVKADERGQESTVEDADMSVSSTSYAEEVWPGDAGRGPGSKPVKGCSPFGWPLALPVRTGAAGPALSGRPTA
jgi:hypothetical protein